MNQEMFEKHFRNQNSHYEKYGQFLLQREAITYYHQINTLCCQQDEWDTKEDTGKSMKNALYVLWYAKRHPSGQSNVESDIEQWKNQACSLSRYRVTLV